MKRNYNKASRMYLLKNKSTIINFLVLFVLSIPLTILIQSEMMASVGEEMQLFVMYILILGLGWLQVNSMVVDLMMKDCLTRRIEFFLASNGDVIELIKAYTFEIFRFAAIIPFFVFIICFYRIDWTFSFTSMCVLYISTVMISYFEGLLLNTLALTVRKMKLFKNILFFSSFILFYVGVNLANVFMGISSNLSISLDILVIAFNVVVCFIFAGITLYRMKGLKNETVIRREALWE